MFVFLVAMARMRKRLMSLRNRKARTPPGPEGSNGRVPCGVRSGFFYAANDVRMPDARGFRRAGPQRALHCNALALNAAESE